MSVSIGAPRRIGAFLIAPLVRARERSGRAANAVWVRAELMPIGLAVRHRGRVTILAMDGREHDATAFAEIRPELLRVLEEDS